MALLDSWQGDAAMVSTLAERRRALLSALLPFLWDENSTAGHPDPGVRAMARAERMERTWADQLHEITPSVSPQKERYEQIKEWSGWPDLPDISWGPCATCANAVEGRERGWAFPCSPCKRPTHSHYMPSDGTLPSLTPTVGRLPRPAGAAPGNTASATAALGPSAKANSGTNLKDQSQ